MRLALLYVCARACRVGLGMKVLSGRFTKRKRGAYEVAVGIAERRDDTGRHFALVVEATNTPSSEDTVWSCCGMKVRVNMLQKW